jgi:uncharacterized membrane protein (UPF0127 family)
MLLIAKNETKGTVLSSRARVASSILERSIGLLGTSALPAGEGLWLKPCRGVHTFFMRYPIDALFLDGQGVVVSQQTLKPWRISGWNTRAEGVLELPEGTLAKSKTEVGDKVSLKQI